MSAPAASATGVTFSWLGLVLATSFMEAPLKFRAPGLELAVGLAIDIRYQRADEPIDHRWQQDWHDTDGL